MTRHLLSDYPLLLIDATLRIMLLVSLVRYRMAPRLTLLRYYLGFGVLSYILCFFFGSATAYWRYYWTVQGLGYLFQAGLSISIMNTLNAGKRESRGIVGSTITVLLGLCSLKFIYIQDWTTVLNICLWSDLACWFLLLWSLTYVKNWLWPYRGIAFGLALSIGLHLCCVVLQGNADPSPLLRVFYQLSSIAGLTVWTLNLRECRRLKALMASV